jgi:hypothetical protein
MAERIEREPTTMMLIGFVVGTVTIGVVVYLIIKGLRATLDGVLAGRNLAGSGQPINIYNVTGNPGSMSLPSPVQAQPSPLATAMQLGDASSLATRTNTMTLDPVRSYRVFSAPKQGVMWRVRLHVIGPAGGYGLFAVDSPLPAEANTNLTIGAPQGIVVPANGATELRIGPRQVIYGKAAGTEDEVQVSVIASAEVF